MNDRRPLGTGPQPLPAEPPAPRAQLAAERLLAAAPAAEPQHAPRPTGRRTLGAGPDPTGL
ncbi:hypothetical protein [Streptomyces sp. NPDC001270]|uniref:hypothetical protein n=1 Tax=Streptomyces sp. NPDC001270 TaxID=3364554 RepID=UPI003682B454